MDELMMAAKAKIIADEMAKNNNVEKTKKDIATQINNKCNLGCYHLIFVVDYAKADDIDYNIFVSWLEGYGYDVDAYVNDHDGFLRLHISWYHAEV